jgi:adenine deaminase
MTPSIAEKQRLVRVARGLEPADVVIRGARVLDVFTLEVLDADVAICGAWIAGVGRGYQGQQVIEAHGAFLAPGLVDAHIHLESAMMTPRRFAEAVLPRGTVGVVAEPHEIVNVVGMRGLEWMLEAGRRSGMRVWASAPSCVPASPFESAGAVVGPAEVANALNLPGVVGLAEMMNFPGVLNGDPNVWAILQAAQNHRQDGHAAGLTGVNWTAYAAAGLESDHEAVTPEQALERIRTGTWLMVREGSAARNLAAIAPVLERYRPHRMMFVSDDVDAAELLEAGHLDRILREAVRLGVHPVYAVRSCSLTPAEYWRLPNRGAIVPGHVADLVLFDDLKDFNTQLVMVDGQVRVSDGELISKDTLTPSTTGLEQTVRLPTDWTMGRLALRVDRPMPVIGIHPDQIYTETLESVSVTQADPGRDLVKLAVIERHRGTGRTGVGLARGIGLKRGAMGQTVAHDAHNIILAGVNDEDMALAARELERMGGGAVVVLYGQVLARLSLPIAGLISDSVPLKLVLAQRALEAAARDLGCILPHPIMTLSFMALTVIPSLKITDRGLFDMATFRLLEPERAI